MEIDIEDQVAALVDDRAFQEIDHQLRRFNLFEAIGAIKGELRHSDFLAFILSPARPHGLGSELLLRVLRTIFAKIPPARREIRTLELILADLERAIIYRERDNIDLLIDVEELGLIVAIENKIGAQVSESQLRRNKVTVTQKFHNHRFLFVLLTPHGTKPEDSDYVAFSYTELADVIEALLRDQREGLSVEIAVVLRHYIDMLRRNIVEDDKLAQMAIRLYEKHKEAFDFISRHQPQPTSLLDHIQKLISSNKTLKEDKHNPAMLRFVPIEWTTQRQLNSCPPSGWTKTGRSVMFEIKANEKGRIIVALVLGPSDREGLRERMYTEAKKRKDLFVGLVKPMGLKWSTIFSIELMTASEAKGMGQEEQIEAIEVAWQNFVDSRLPGLKKAIIEFV